MSALPEFAYFNGNTPPGPTGVAVFEDWLRVSLPDAGHADFHFRWLRHNDPRNRHAVTNEPTLDSSELPETLRAVSANVQGDDLEVRWSDLAQASRYPLAWLRHHAYAVNRELVPPPPSDLGRIELVVPDVTAETVVREALARVRALGAVLVRQAPGRATTPEAETEPLIQRFIESGLSVVETHFGRVEDLRTDNTTNSNTDQLGYTDSAIDLHTDQPFLERPPRYQLLQSLRAADEGGENSIVDARAAAQYLRSVDRPAFDLLVQTPVTFHRKQKHFERVVTSPLLRDVDGPRFQVRSSYFTLAPFQRPFDETAAWYRALDRFTRLVRHPAHQYRFRLGPGDYVLYDNHRMLHARTRFRGGRWVRGVYFND